MIPELGPPCPACKGSGYDGPPPKGPHLDLARPGCLDCLGGGELPAEGIAWFGELSQHDKIRISKALLRWGSRPGPERREVDHG